VFSGLLWVSPGNCCFVPWLALFSIQIVVFLLFVVVIAFWCITRMQSLPLKIGSVLLRLLQQPHQNRSVQFPNHTQTSSNSSTIAAGSSDGLTSTRYCKYSCVCSWWWVEIPPKTCRAVFQKLINCVMLQLVGNISKGINVKNIRCYSWFIWAPCNNCGSTAHKVRNEFYDISQKITKFI
jgi:hypothetical protein